MACGITAITKNVTNCSKGGIIRALGNSCANVTDFTIDADGIITAFTLANAAFANLAFEGDDSAFYNSTGSRTGDNIVYDQESLVRFNGHSNDKMKAVDTAAQCCCAVFVYELEDGTIEIQGIDFPKDLGAGTYNTVDYLPKQNAKVTPSILSDVGGQETGSRVEYSITSQARYSPATTSLTMTAIAALAPA